MTRIKRINEMSFGSNYDNYMVMAWSADAGSLKKYVFKNVEQKDLALVEFDGWEGTLDEFLKRIDEFGTKTSTTITISRPDERSAQFVLYLDNEQFGTFVVTNKKDSVREIEHRIDTDLYTSIAL